MCTLNFAAYAIGSSHSIVPISKLVPSSARYASLAPVELGEAGEITDAKYTSSTNFVDYRDPYIFLLLLRIGEVLGGSIGIGDGIDGEGISGIIYFNVAVGRS